jgi:hypothetical protein
MPGRRSANSSTLQERALFAAAGRSKDREDEDEDEEGDEEDAAMRTGRRRGNAKARRRPEAGQ